MTDLASLDLQAVNIGDEPENKSRHKNSNDNADHVSRDTEIVESRLRDFVDDVGDLLTSCVARIGLRPVFDVLLDILAQKVPNSLHNIGDAWEGGTDELALAVVSWPPNILEIEGGSALVEGFVSVPRIS
jgi:hypothetical protein